MKKRLLVVALLATFSSAAAAQSSVAVTVSEWKIKLPSDTIAAGSVRFRVRNDGNVVHAVMVEGNGVRKETPQIAAGQTMTLTVSLKPGTYELYCPMSEMTHKQAGMTKQIVVVDKPKSP